MNAEYLKNFDTVKETVSIEDVVKDYFSLKREGQNLKACCPFHADKRASFTVSPAKKIFSCFGCGISGDVIKFVALSENLKMGQAMEKLAHQYNIPLVGLREKSEAQNPLYEANYAAYKKFMSNMKGAPREAKTSLLINRGINTPAIIEKWGIGYATHESPLPSNLSAQGQALGILNDKGNCRFANRFIFPVQNQYGRILAFAGRDVTSQSEAKYINSPDSEIYHKGDLLYGLFYAAKHIKASNSAIIVEGYYDCILMHEVAGFPCTVATCGTALTENQAKAISHLCDSALLMFDADMWETPAKHERLIAAICRLWEQGVDVTILRLPEGDPADAAMAYSGQILDICSAYRPCELFKEFGLALEAVATNIAKIKNPARMQGHIQDACMLYETNIHILSRLIRAKRNV